MPLRYFRSLSYVIFALSYAVHAHGGMLMPATLTDLTTSADRIFRGHCMAAEVTTAAVAGVRIPVTTYTFKVSEYLKGTAADTITFRQVGTPEGGPRDLGRLVGLPNYVPGTEYVLFLLPESDARLTSPAGSGQGVFVVSDKGGLMHATRPMRMQSLPHGVEAMSYEALRRAVLKEGNQ